MKRLGEQMKIVGGSMLSLLLVLSPVVASAATDSKATNIEVTVESVITMTTGSTVTMVVTPTSDGRMSSASDTVTVTTNNPTGYTLKLGSSDATTALTKGPDTISAHTGSPSTPTTLATNSWGYRVDGAASFGAGPTSAESSVSSSVYTWAGLPAAGNDHTLRTTAATATNQTTAVWYGVSTNLAKPSGLYTETVTYTATTN